MTKLKRNHVAKTIKKYQYPYFADRVAIIIPQQTEVPPENRDFCKERKNSEGSLLVKRKGKAKRKPLDEIEEKLLANELSLYEEALQLDKKRKASYIH